MNSAEAFQHAMVRVGRLELLAREHANRATDLAAEEWGSDADFYNGVAGAWRHAERELAAVVTEFAELRNKEARGD